MGNVRTLPKRFWHGVCNFHRTASIYVLFVLYPLIAIALSAAVSLWIFGNAAPASQAVTGGESGAMPSPAKAASRERALVNAPVLDSPGVSLAPVKDLDETFQSRRIASDATVENSELKYELANIEFRAGNYAEAERLYQQVLPKARAKSQIVYQIYCCLLAQNRRAEAEVVLMQISQMNREGRKSPVWYYAMAARANQDGDSAKAKEFISEGRQLYPQAGAQFEPTLRAMGYLE